MESIENLQFEIDCLTTDRDDLQSYVVDLKAIVDDLTFKNEALVEKLQDSAVKILDLNQTMTNLKVDNDSLNHELKFLKHEYDSTRGLWCVDINPSFVDIEWIRNNCFQLT